MALINCLVGDTWYTLFGGQPLIVVVVSFVVVVIAHAVEGNATKHKSHNSDRNPKPSTSTQAATAPAAGTLRSSAYAPNAYVTGIRYIFILLSFFFFVLWVVLCKKALINYQSVIFTDFAIGWL